MKESILAWKFVELYKECWVWRAVNSTGYIEGQSCGHYKNRKSAVQNARLFGYRGL